MSAKNCLLLAAIFGFLGVLLGAFGAHGLSDTNYLKDKYADIEPKNVSGLSMSASYKYLQDFKTGVRYHMWHALAMFGTGLLMLRAPSRLLSAATWCFTGGIVLFSGALYVLVILGPKFGGITWGMVAPIGGSLLLVAWLLLSISTFRMQLVDEVDKV